MSNIPLITAREYLTRVKKKSFIIMTLLAPVLISAFYGGIIWVSTNDNVGASEKHIVVLDQSGIFEGEIDQYKTVNFSFDNSYNRDSLLNGTADGFLIIEKDYDISKPLKLSYETQGSLSAKETSYIENAFSSVIKTKKLGQYGISQSVIDSLKSPVSIQELKIDETGEAKSSSIVINTVIGMGLSLMIYLFIFLYGVQVMRGVIEEKTNRIVELMVSSVRPFELMMGKVLGIAAVGLTQLAIWIALSTGLTFAITAAFGMSLSQGATAGMPTEAVDISQQGQIGEAIQAFMDLPLFKIFAIFLFFFLAGYLFYGALFAAVGSAVDSETDTQQFMMPITLPLVFSFIVSFSVVINDPNGTLATWLSMIPITSPIVMMARIPFDPPTWQLLLSMVIMVLSIFGVIWLAGRIYRTGILMYGKKPSYKEIAKWLFYKN